MTNEIPAVTGTLIANVIPLSKADTKYYLWSTRSAGWITHAGTYTSDRVNAKLVEYTEAIEACKVHRGYGAEFGLVPVAAEMLKEIKQ